MSAGPDVAVPIFAGAGGHAEDFWVPGFKLQSRGRSFPPQVIRDVTQVQYKDDLDKIDQVDLTLSNWDDENNTFSYSDSGRFLPGQELEVWLGYSGSDQLRKVITAEITSFRPSFPSGAQSNITITGLNVLHRLRRKPATRIYQAKTPTQIARQIADIMKVDLDTAPLDEQPYDYLLQDGYDVIFLLQLARRSGYDLFVQEGAGTRDRPRLFFGTSNEVHRVIYKLRYGASLIEFSPSLTTTRQVGSVTVRGWDRRSKTVVSVTYTRKQLGLGGLDDEVEPAFSQRAEVVTAIVTDKAEAQRLARDRLRDIAHEMVTATGSTLGLPDLRAGSVIEVSGVGKRFSGRYFLTSTTHTLGASGYTTSFACRRQ